MTELLQSQRNGAQFVVLDLPVRDGQPPAPSPSRTLVDGVIVVARGRRYEGAVRG